jgi:hypothetical protein
MPSPVPDPVLKSATREALSVLAIWLAALGYVVPYCYINGYNRDLADLKFVLGFPDWIFWGVVVPWCVCILLSIWFGATLIRDQDLGEELPEQEDELGLGGG